MSKIALAVLLGIASPMVSAQTVYKCTKADGSAMFSQSPCGKDAKIVMGNSPAPKDASGDRSPDTKSPGSPPTTDPNVQAISDSVDDANCRRDAQRLATEPPSTERIDQAKAELAQLQLQAGAASVENANSDYAQSTGQPYAQQIADLNDFISSEQARINALVVDSQKKVEEALAACDRKKSERETRMQK